MKYWKQGFYDHPVEGAVEITEGKWRRLLDGQARGMEIVGDEDGMPVLREPKSDSSHLRAARAAADSGTLFGG